ncbi:MAG TPA: TetR family transcriptional regulator [Pseudolysinimonas sp.]|nr:TetR family transcriptional regulator [Pseudolysinimonas sp.]
MTRWQPDARGRLVLAAMELYLDRGFGQTTVAQIAERAGVTERTFFRYFADKREMLFGGSEQLQQLMVDAVAGAPASATPLDAVGAALDAVGAVFVDLDYSRTRQRIIDSDDSLQERELIKRDRLATAVTQALRARGVAEPTASLAAQTGIGVFHIAFASWIAPANTSSYAEIARGLLDELRTVTRPR